MTSDYSHHSSLNWISNYGFLDRALSPTTAERLHDLLDKSGLGLIVPLRALSLLIVQRSIPGAR